jgi:hypothetical protein
MATTNTILHFDEGNFNQKVQQLERLQRVYQSIMNEMTKLNLFKIKTIPELRSVISNTEQYIHQRLEEEIQLPTESWGPFKISRKKAVDLLDLPDLQNLFDLCADSVQNLNGNLDQYLSIKGQQIIIQEESVEKLKEENSLMAKTSDQKQLFEAHKKAAEAMHAFNLLHSKVLGFGLSGDTELRNLFCINNGGLKTTYNDYFYLQNRFQSND